jgi:putative membrane protein
MDRRVILAGFAASAIAGQAFAQTKAPSTAQSGASSGSRMNRSGGQLGQAEMQHMQQTMQLGMVALETSRIAMQKVQNEDLKKFANFEVQEQTTLSEVLHSMMEPAAAAATGAGRAQQNTNVPADAASNLQMDAASRDMIQKLQNQQAGTEFDRDYLEGQLKGHRDLLQVQERYLQSNPQDREHMNVTKMARGHIREHVAILEDMQRKMRG